MVLTVKARARVVHEEQGSIELHAGVYVVRRQREYMPDEVRMGRTDDDRPLVHVNVKNATAEPDGSFKGYWLRVPPDVRTAREAVAWTFGFAAEAYSPLVET